MYHVCFLGSINDVDRDASVTKSAVDLFSHNLVTMETSSSSSSRYICLK